MKPNDTRLTPLEKAHRENKRRRDAGIKIVILNPLEKAKKNPSSMRAAINAKCYDCIYDDLDQGTWRDQVNACTATDCPLWCHRPLSTRQPQ